MVKQDSYHFVVESDFDGLRLDQFLSTSLSEKFSRSELQKWIKDGCVSVNGSVARQGSRKVRAGDSLEAVPRIVPEHHQAPEPIDFAVLFEDSYLAVIHKPAGLSVHPGPGDTQITLLNGLIHRWPALRGQGSRPGIVHRLDKPTEGLLLVALDHSIQWKLSRQFQERKVHKRYIAYLLSTPAELEGTLEFPLMRDRIDRRKRTVHASGRPATTIYRVTDIIKTRKGRKLCRVEIELITGRTHQIRAHFAHIGCPVVGDDLYSKSHKEFGKFGLLLLAAELGFTHPVTGESMHFELEEPDRFRQFAAKAEFY
ncbi:MAG: RluA family pseudouridine synthase [Leptospiraceae bacterium]|nr:RluA family pseudouridine synthase [Leptospiraceae bacterium]